MTNSNPPDKHSLFKWVRRCAEATTRNTEANFSVLCPWDCADETNSALVDAHEGNQLYNFMANVERSASDMGFSSVHSFVEIPLRVTTPGRLDGLVILRGLQSVAILIEAKNHHVTRAYDDARRLDLIGVKTVQRLTEVSWLRENSVVIGVILINRWVNRDADMTRLLAKHVPAWASIGWELSCPRVTDPFVNKGKQRRCALLLGLKDLGAVSVPGHGD